ncbi:sulfite exporter TauE/SafE [Hoeflea marina]|uniref:Probable membrane transporter protein n=1 Tax=Hoeflea marina TaxID=274592 RepID=A0A317PPV5_9HYPH|nr:sulfite exporter TauE/SafE family protein [Hoeflea marina]PWW00471.1 sulfite exporter TauE/SafE [Hoeflea marina]
MLVSFFTSALTIAAGIGGGLALLAIMTYLVPIAALIPVHGMVQLGSNIGRATLLRSHIAWPCVLAFLAGGIPGAWFGGLAVGWVDESVMTLTLGLFILGLTWTPLPAMAGISTPGYVLTGAVTSFLTMIFGATGPFNAVVLSKAFASRMRLAATLAAIMSVQHLLKFAAFSLIGFAYGPWLPLIALMIITGLAGTWVGRFALIRTSERSFRFVFSVCLSLLALDLIRRGVAGMPHA